MRFQLVILFVIITTFCYSQNLTVMTYNIRYDNKGDGENQWDKRKKLLVDQIRFYQPHIFGIQEGLLHQVTYLDESLIDYGYVGVGRDDGKDKGEFSAIFYRKDLLDTLTQGTFWLSDKPGSPSVGWDASMERICTYAKFSYQNNSFWVFNTHFDHIGEIARLESAKLILRQINRLNIKKMPEILMGDFNAKPNSEPIMFITRIMKDSRVTADHFYGGETTFNGFNLEFDQNNRIDYIFHSDNIKVIRAATLAEVQDQKFPSDHFPVISYLMFEN